MTTTSNDQAFPCCEEIYYDEQKVGITYHEGLTKREYLAALILSGYIQIDSTYSQPEAMARRVLEFTDALIAALNEKSDRSK